MAKLEGGTVKLELTYEELVALKSALKVAETYDYNAMWRPLLNDLEGGAQ